MDNGATWKGKKIADMTREELINIIFDLVRGIDEIRKDHQAEMKILFGDPERWQHIGIIEK